ncbi:hypothetical protein EDB80DRAFT_727524 [Ilyonectria destructans]|nr:hypothetical protein EDB80DRAFT_727524 [Ilyonectria destructans]
MSYPESRVMQMKFGGIIANLEGRNITFLPEDLLANSTLAELNTRVRRLETHHAITLAPPSLATTWDSLALRICRVKQKTDVAYPTKGTIDSDFASMVPDNLDISIDTLQTLCSDLARYHPSAPAPSWPKCAHDDEMLDVIRQRLCHTAGRNRIVVTPIPISRLDVYAQLVGVTLKLEEGELPYMRGIPGALPPAPKKACCGCCLCTCHTSPPRNQGIYVHESRRAPRSYGYGSEREVPKRKTFGFGWLKGLAFWRRSKVNDDASSYTSRTGSTIVDRY